MISVPAYAKKPEKDVHKIVMDDKNVERKIKEIEGKTDYSDLTIEVTLNIKAERTQIYVGPLGEEQWVYRQMV